MDEKTCTRCGETVVMAEDGETITDGETPIEHLDRTGHIHIREPVPTDCNQCGKIWMYQGNAERVTCPRCKGKTKPGITSIVTQENWERRAPDEARED